MKRFNGTMLLEQTIDLASVEFEPSRPFWSDPAGMGKGSVGLKARRSHGQRLTRTQRRLARQRHTSFVQPDRPLELLGALV